MLKYNIHYANFKIIHFSKLCFNIKKETCQKFEAVENLYQNIVLQVAPSRDRYLKRFVIEDTLDRM